MNLHCTKWNYRFLKTVFIRLDETTISNFITENLCLFFSAWHCATGQIVTILDCFLIHSFGQQSLLNEHQAYRTIRDYI